MKQESNAITLKTSEKVKILVTIKTYPHPSVNHRELVCTAGVKEDGSFIRIYPINYRYLPNEQLYEKYQWIEVEVQKNEKDPRPESFRPILSTLRPLCKPLETRNGWFERRKYVLAKPLVSMCELEALSCKERSLGIIKPKEVFDFIAQPSERKWKADWEMLFNRERLVGPQQKPLNKVPFDFKYKFRCQHPSCKGHTKSITDWEVGMLYFNMLNKYKSEQIAVEKVRQKFFTDLCSPQKDTHFFVGTALGKKAWMILGVFYPDIAESYRTSLLSFNK